MRWRVLYTYIYCSRRVSCEIIWIYTSHLTRVKRGKERNVVVVESFVSKSNTYRRSIWLIHIGICWTLISNGSHGHLNNHLAHPPSLNSLHVFSPLRPSIFLFSEPTTLSETHVLTIEEKWVPSLGFPFVPVTQLIEKTHYYSQLLCESIVPKS